MNSICLLFSITTYSSHSVLLNILLLTPAFVLYLQPPFAAAAKDKFVESRRKQEKPPTSASKSAPQSNHKAFVTVYRGGMMVITCLAILAVDFKVFPRRFAKAELFGTSLVGFECAVQLLMIDGHGSRFICVFKWPCFVTETPDFRVQANLHCHTSKCVYPCIRNSTHCLD